MQETWKQLSKNVCKYHQSFRLTSTFNCRLSQIAFNSFEENLIAIDNKGQAYIIDLSRPDFACKKIGYVGQCTFVEYNPLNNKNIIIGLNTNDIKVTQINDLSSYCILSGHSLPPKRATFYKEYCMTVSSNDTIIWHLETFSKAHYLKLFSDNLSIKTAVFSSFGLITVLYKNNVIQSWTFKRFDETVKIKLNDFDLQNVKDITFSKNGTMMIVGGNKSIIVFDSTSWKIMKKIDHSQHNCSINKIILLERPLNFVAVSLLSDCNLEFFDLSASKLIKHCDCLAIKMIKRMQISDKGKFLAHLRADGELVISNLEKMLTEQICTKKCRDIVNNKTSLHRTEEYLYTVQMAIKEELKLQRLLPILKEFGEYPDRHRALIWSTIMHLPSNEEAFLTLINSVSESVIENPIKKFHLCDKTKATLLATIVNCLIKWCPLLEHSEFIPELIFPFIVVFQKSPMLALECSLVIILNFCQKWFEYHPLPPLNILGIIENMLLEADPNLLNFFYENGITWNDYAWPLLRTTFSEVLLTNEWLALWDHLLSYGRLSLLLCCVVAFNLCCRQVIMTSIKTSEDVQQFYSSQSQIQAKKLLKIAQDLDKLMPARIHPKEYIRDSWISLPVSNTYPLLSQLEYPKMMVDEIDLECIKNRKKQQLIDQKEENKTVELAEKRRLEFETEQFREKIHKARLDEAHKYYEELLLGDMNIEKDVHDVVWDTCKTTKRLCQNLNKVSLSKQISIRQRQDPMKMQFCQNMAKEVQLLEQEANKLLGKTCGYRVIK